MTTLSADLLRKMGTWWRAANCLSLGKIYLHANPLLEQPLTLAQETQQIGWRTGQNVCRLKNTQRR